MTPVQRRRLIAQRLALQASVPFEPLPPLGDPPTVRTFVQTCAARCDKLDATLASLEASDLAGKYEVLKSPMFRQDGWRATERWYMETMARLATEPLPHTAAPPDLLLRLEDDTIVNRHLLANLRSWPAIRRPRFGAGVLFKGDDERLLPPGTLRVDEDGCICRLDLDVGGAQGNVYRTALVPRWLQLLDRARRASNRLHGPSTYDDVTTHAIRLVGAEVYCHLPSLVNCHDGCEVSLCFAYVGPRGDRAFSLDWQRESP